MRVFFVNFVLIFAVSSCDLLLMEYKNTIKWIYKVVRSILFSAIIFVGVLFVSIYILLSIPAVQDKIRSIAEDELSALMTSRLTIDHVTISPFNEVVVEGVELFEPQQEGRPVKTVAHIERVGAGISLFNLIFHRKIIITYVELIGLNGNLRQDVKDGPLNIQFLIDAFASKDKNKPPTQFDLRIRNIVIRKSNVEFARPWLNGSGCTFPNSAIIALTGLNADVALPRLSNDYTEIDLRRLEFELQNHLKVQKISGVGTLDHGMLSLKDLEIETAGSFVKVGDLEIPVGKPGGINEWLDKGNIAVELDIERLNPKDFAAFYPPLAELNLPLKANLQAHGNRHSFSIDNFAVETTYPSRKGADGYFQLSVADVAIDMDALGGKRIIPVGFDNIEIKNLALYATPSVERKIASILPSGSKARSIVESPGNLELTFSGRLSAISGQAGLQLNITSDVGNLNVESELLASGANDRLEVIMEAADLQLGKLLATERVGKVNCSLDAAATFSESLFKNPQLSIERLAEFIKEADVSLTVPDVEVDGYRLADLQMNVSKKGRDLSADITCDDENFDLALDGDAILSGDASSVILSADIRAFRPTVIQGLASKWPFDISGEIEAEIKGLNVDNMEGNLLLSNLHFFNMRNNRTIDLNRLKVEAYIADDSEGGRRTYDIYSDWIEGSINGHFRPSHLPRLIAGMLSDTFPSLVPAPAGWSGPDEDDYMTVDLRIFKDGNWNETLGLPVKLLSDAVIVGEVDGENGMMTLDFDAPFIQQGKDKLIRDTRFSARLWEGTGSVDFGVIYPTKKGDLNLEAEMESREDKFDIDLNFNPGRTTGFYGKMALEATIGESLKPLGRSVIIHILPGQLYLNGAAWNVNDATLSYIPSSAGPTATIEGFGIYHDRQFISIAGVASSSEDDIVDVRLSEIDLDYVFDTLNINYVKFGGMASGEAYGKALFSSNPIAETKRLYVKDLKYNGAVLGDGELHGDFDMSKKRVGIRADVAENNKRVALIDGGIWIGRDSLSFGIDADKVRIGFLQPFMSAFSSNVSGRASGKALLYGTFSDVDLKGRLFADTISLKVDYTNVTYTGARDSVFITPGRIDIPAFTIKDQYGNKAILRGELTHRYFHEPEFDFRVSDAKNFLLYDTNRSMNQRWYGRVFGSGSGRILGRGNYVGISADMATQAGTVFTLELSDREEAANYRFLTFTDKHKSAIEAEAEVQLSESEKIIRAFQKSSETSSGDDSVFGMDIRASISPASKLIIIMDPVAGDKITARGDGALNMSYRSDTEEMKVLGKYVLDEGVYNFSLQDLILRDFIIKRGSSISFNGDPMAGILDIHAAYRVNTNLTDLDASFATDRDLNRTQVPVDAMLNVTGEMQHPDISFDIELPTLNGEVAQKVRSIISSEEMMNLQMIYLLALNRFYTPEYMGGNSGGEWASVASSTLSSQLSNIFGQLTDKVFIAPSFRSDKGDFSDLEVDLALSSRLFNNRLLINGNFGYRDPSTSSTTFVGDFDIEYLLNRTGNWRLKAYNHFNDQNYYLKSALTTQGVGIIWRRDFNHLFRKKKADATPDAIDSVGNK